MTFGRDLLIDLTVGDFHPGLVLCRKCHYGCLGDHEGNGANRCALHENSVGKRGVSGTVLREIDI